MKKNIKKIRQKDLKFDQIMGINVLGTTTSKVLTAVKEKISHNVKFSILTPNPELVLMAQDNKELRNALNSADFPIPDGVGLKLAIPGLKIIKGRELFLDLVELAQKNKWKVFLLGGLNNEAELVAKKFGFQYAGGPEVTTDLSKDIVDRINKFAPDLLFVAFSNPKQEIWIHKNLSKLKIGGAMAVGGTFRYIAGLSKLPPDWLAKLGLEWLWRLIMEPYRWNRVFRASVVFPLKLFWYKIYGNPS